MPFAAFSCGSCRACSLPSLIMSVLDAFCPLLRNAGEEGTQSLCDWGGEGNEVEVPSSIPSCSAIATQDGPLSSPAAQEKTKVEKGFVTACGAPQLLSFPRSENLPENIFQCRRSRARPAPRGSSPPRAEIVGIAPPPAPSWGQLACKTLQNAFEDCRNDCSPVVLRFAEPDRRQRQGLSELNRSWPARPEHWWLQWQKFFRTEYRPIREQGVSFQPVQPQAIHRYLPALPCHLQWLRSLLNHRDQNCRRLHPEDQAMLLTPRNRFAICF